MTDYNFINSGMLFQLKAYFMHVSHGKNSSQH